MTDYHDCSTREAGECGDLPPYRRWERYGVAIFGMAPALIVVLITSRGFSRIQTALALELWALIFVIILAMIVAFFTVYLIGKRRMLSLEAYGMHSAAVSSTLIATLIAGIGRIW